MSTVQNSGFGAKAGLEAPASATRRDCCGALQFLLYSIGKFKHGFSEETKLEEREIMKIATKLVAVAAMLAAGTIVSGSFGEPVPFPIPPGQISQSGTFGEPVPFPIPPGQISQSRTFGEPVPFPIPPASVERV